MLLEDPLSESALQRAGEQLVSTISFLVERRIDFSVAFKADASGCSVSIFDEHKAQILERAWSFSEHFDCRLEWLPSGGGMLQRPGVKGRSLPPVLMTVGTVLGKFSCSPVIKARVQPRMVFV